MTNPAARSESPTHPDAPADPRSHYNAAPIDRNVQQLLASLNLATGDFDARIRVALHELKDRRDADATRLLFSTHPDAPRAGGETPEMLPCPFCGHPPYVSRSANGTEMLFVGCAVCGIEFKAAWYRDAANPTRDIVAAWNQRASLLERHRDGERLDWLQRHPLAIPLQHDASGWRTKEATMLREIGPFPSLRDAIDAAQPKETTDAG